MPTYTARQHVIHECTKAPPIHCFAMTTACQNLWSPERENDAVRPGVTKMAILGAVGEMYETGNHL